MPPDGGALGASQRVLLEFLVHHFVAHARWTLERELGTALIPRGIERPREVLLSLPPGLVRVDVPLEDSSVVRVTAQGIQLVDPNTRSLRLLVLAIRRLLDWLVTIPEPPIDDQYFWPSGNDLLSTLSTDVPLAEQLAVGQLLESESMTEVSWSMDGSSWRARCHGGLWARFKGVYDVRSLLRALDDAPFP